MKTSFNYCLSFSNNYLAIWLASWVVSQKVYLISYAIVCYINAIVNASVSWSNFGWEYSKYTARYICKACELKNCKVCNHNVQLLVSPSLCFTYYAFEQCPKNCLLCSILCPLLYTAQFIYNFIILMTTIVI